MKQKKVYEKYREKYMNRKEVEVKKNKKVKIFIKKLGSYQAKS